MGEGPTGLCRACGERVQFERRERDDDLGVGYERVCPECGTGNGTPRR